MGALRKVVGVASVFCLVAVFAVSTAGEVRENRLAFGTEDTIVSIRTRSINDTLQKLTEMVTKVEPQAGAMMAGAPQMIFGQFQGVDLNGPAALLILDPKEHEDEAVVGVFTLAQAGQFQGPPDAESRAVGTLGLVADTDAILDTMARMLADKEIEVIPTRDMTDQIVVQGDIGWLLQRYKEDIESGLKEGREELEEADPDEVPDELKQIGLRALEHVGRLIEQVGAQAGLADLGVSFSEDLITSNLSMEAMPDSDFAEFLGKNNIPANKELTRWLPEESIYTFIHSFDPQSMSALYQGLVAGLGEIAGLPEAERDQIQVALSNMYGQMTGRQAQAQVPTEKGLASISMIGTRDAGGARAATRQFVALAKQGTLAEVLDKYGVNIEWTEAHRTHEGIPIDKMELNIDAEKMARALPFEEMDEEELAEFTEAVKKGLQGRDGTVTEIVYATSVMVTVDVSEGPEPMNKMIDLVRTSRGIGRNADYQAALDKHPAESVALWHVSLYGVIGGVSRTINEMMDDDEDEMMMGPGALLPARDELPDEEELITGSARIEGNRIVATNHIPVQPVAALLKVMQEKMQAMMMQQFEQQPMPPMGP